MGIKKNNPGCDCCGCVRGCEDTVTDPWVIQGSAANRYGSLTLTGVTAFMVDSNDAVRLELSTLGSGERALRVISNTNVVLCEYKTFVLEVAPVVLPLTEVNGSGVSGSITKTNNDWPNQAFFAWGTRRPKLTVNGTRVRRISWELIDVPDPWDWEFDTFQPYFPNDPVTLTDTWNGMSGLIGEYIVDLDTLQCRDGRNFSISPYVAIDEQERLVGSLDGHSILFNESSQRLEFVAVNVPAYYGLSFTDSDFTGSFLTGPNLTGGKSYINSGGQSTLFRGDGTLSFLARTCLATPQRTDAILTSSLGGNNNNYRSTGSVTWRVRLLET